MGKVWRIQTIFNKVQRTHEMLTLTCKVAKRRPLNRTIQENVLIKLTFCKKCKRRQQVSNDHVTENVITNCVKGDRVSPNWTSLSDASISYVRCPRELSLQALLTVTIRRRGSSCQKRESINMRRFKIFLFIEIHRDLFKHHHKLQMYWIKY